MDRMEKSHRGMYADSRNMFMGRDRTELYEERDLKIRSCCTDFPIILR